VNTLLCSDLMVFIVENADSQEYLNPNIVRTENASFLEAGYCESGTNLAQKLTVNFIQFCTSHACKSTVSSCSNTGTYLGKLMQPRLSTHYVNNEINKSVKYWYFRSDFALN